MNIDVTYSPDVFTCVELSPSGPAIPFTGVSLFGTSEGPGPADLANMALAGEFGVVFQASVPGTITAIRFYKNALNVGVHVGNLWTLADDGSPALASVTFSDETATGWQQGNFVQPVHIDAATNYIASYHIDDTGTYSCTSGYFNSASRIVGVLTAPTDGDVCGNGRVTYGDTSARPTSTYNGSNFWVDVVFVPDNDFMLPARATGEWAYNINYGPGDTVIRFNSLYGSTKPSVARPPELSSDCWALLFSSPGSIRIHN
jgi:Domain of unknown function (DUF4082)